jgi:hypothetical protein
MASSLCQILVFREVSFCGSVAHTASSDRLYTFECE